MFLLNHKLHNNSIHALGEDGAVRIVFSFTKEKERGTPKPLSSTPY